MSCAYFPPAAGERASGCKVRALQPGALLGDWGIALRCKTSLNGVRILTCAPIKGAATVH